MYPGLLFPFFVWQIFFGNIIPDTEIRINEHVFFVEIADDGLSQRKGLMSRLYLAPDHGMFFIYDDLSIQTFWMKNTLIPLDIIFFDSESRITDIYHNVPPCRFDPCPLYTSSVSSASVFELPGGTAQRIGLEIRDQWY